MKQNLTGLVEQGLRVLLVSPPGMAKTARLAAVADKLKWDFDHVPLHHTERVDWGGGFVPDQARNVMRQLPLERLAGWKERRGTGRKVLVLVDDLGKAPVDVQGALKSIITRGSNTLPPEVVIAGATNRPGDKAGVTALDESLRSEFDVAFSIPTPGVDDKPDGPVLLGSWQEEVDGWCEWALDHEAPPEIVAWHRSTVGRTLYGWKPNADPALRMPDFRSWETMIKLWNGKLRDLSTLAASVGKAAAAEFLAFARLADKLPTPDQVRMDPLGAPVPDEPSGQWLIATSLAMAVKPSWAGPMVQYMGRLPRVQAALCGRDAYRRLGAKLSGNREWQTWFEANQELFT